MNNVTKFIILKPANEVFEAFVDPSGIGNFWFSSSSERWEQGKAITLKYEEYNAEVLIKVLEIQANEKIVFSWGEAEDAQIVTISLEEFENRSTIVEIIEEGFMEDDPQLIEKLIDNKEGWVYVLSCLKAYMEFGVTKLRAGIVKN